MDYKNKLKLAKEALDSGSYDKETIEYIFPELAESEDEKIRKELIEFVKSRGGFKQEYIAWLEKQGEQKVSVVEFNAKDWHVSKVDGKIYNAKFMKKNSTNLARKLEIEKAAMSATGIIDREEWFIKGAKWADENPAYISSEKQGEQKPRYSIGDVLCDKSCTTLNKEYQPNFEITDIRNGMYICDKCSFPISQQDEYELVAKRIEQEDTWNKEDERILDALIVSLNNERFAGRLETLKGIGVPLVIDWLKSLRQRMGE